VTIKVTGLKEVEKQLQMLGSKDGTRVLRAAMMRAAQPIEQQAKMNAANLPNGSGALEKSIGRRFVVGRQESSFLILPSLGGRFSVLIAPLKSNRVAVALYNLFYGRKRRGIFHGHFVEFGTKRAKKQPFLAPALNARGAQAVNTLADEIRRGLERLLKRRARQ
jgi:HK97 gp10 family phage protein